MSQHDYVLDNQDGASFRQDINAVLQAIASLNSGATEPSPAYAYQFWADTANGLLKQRNAANNAWTTVATIGKTLLANDSNQVAKAWVNFNGTGTVAIRASYNVTSITDLGTGLFQVNFTNAMSDTNYTTFAMVRTSGNLTTITAIRDNNTYLAGSVQVTALTASPSAFVDSDIFNIAVFR